MAYTPVNPYISLADLREELKMKPADIPSGSTIEDDLLQAIDNASRWIDDYTRRDFFYHDFTVNPMVFDQWDSGIFERTLLPRCTPIISISEIRREDDSVLVEGTDFVVKKDEPDFQQIVCLTGNWFPSSILWQGTQRRTLSIKGTFGYVQNVSVPVTEEGDSASQLANWQLQGLGATPLYWQLDSVGGGNVRVRLFNDAGFANLVSLGTGAASSTVALAQQNSSGISGTVDVAYSADDTDAANKLTPGVPVVNTAVVPAGVPGRIKLATRLVAAAISGRNRKEWVGLDGQKQEILTSAIPNTVFQILGKRSPLLF